MHMEAKLNLPISFVLNVFFDVTNLVEMLKNKKPVPKLWIFLKKKIFEAMTRF